MLKKDSTILVTGSTGMVGKSLVKTINSKGYTNLLVPTSKDLDLTNQADVAKYFDDNKIDYVFHLAGRVGGISANIKSPASFLYDNILIAANVIESARKSGVKKLLYLGSSCIYPKESSQPMKEEYLLSGKLEPTNEGYALAKISGLKLNEFYNKQYNTNFISLMPSNIYGPNDHFGLESSHVVSALITKFHQAKVDSKPYVEVWGTGKARREFLFVEDAVDAMLYFMEKHDAGDLPTFVNIGSGEDVTISELALLIKEIVDYPGQIKFNIDKPDGMMKKLLDTSLAKKFGWQAMTKLKNGLKITYRWYLENVKED